jgi:HEAT repeat protein
MHLPILCAMNFNPIANLQLPLFVYGEPTENILEILPVVWNATESLASPDPVTRNHGIDAILELGIQRSSPLVAYMLAMKLSDTDIIIRRRIVYILGDLIIDEPSLRHTIEVRRTIASVLQSIGEETIYGLLEVAVMDPNVEKSIYHLLNGCPSAGKYLGDILSQWKNPLAIRQKAIYYVGLVGYTEALPVLERLVNRLKARQNVQYTMSFAAPSIQHDEDILPLLRIAIDRLTEH